jgi:hypothetical protein
MALLSKDPASLRMGGGALLLAVPVLLWMAYDFWHDDTKFTAALLIMAATALVSGVLALSRASRLQEQPKMETPSGQHRVLLAVLPFGWLGFGIAYGLAEGKILAFWLSLIPTAITAAVAIYAWRQGPAR